MEWKEDVTEDEVDEKWVMKKGCGSTTMSSMWRRSGRRRKRTPRCQLQNLQDDEW